MLWLSKTTPIRVCNAPQLIRNDGYAHVLVLTGIDELKPVSENECLFVALTDDQLKDLSAKIILYLKK